MLKKNVLANFLGRSWTAVLHLAFTPVYIKLLGLEAFGLVGFFNTVIALAGLFDFGLSSSLQRELPRAQVSKNPNDARNIARAIEIVYWLIALCLAIAMFFLAPFLSHTWFGSHQIASSDLEESIRLMGVALCMQWPFFLYSGGLLGLQKQMRSNISMMIFYTVRFAGAAIVLQFAATPQAFFLWQASVGILQSLAFAILFWNAMPKAEEKSRFALSHLKQIKHFALGMSGIALSGLLLTQADKVILSKTVSLQDFGCYCLAVSCANGLYCIISPIFSAFFPKFSEMVAAASSETIALYHKSSKWMSALLLPIGTVLCLFAKEVLYLWTQNPLIAEKAAPLLSVLAFAIILHGLVHIPYALQLAHGWTSLTVVQNCVAGVVLIPATFFLSQKIGVMGGVWMVLSINIAYFTIGIFLFHKRFYPNETGKWYREDVFIPWAASLIIPLLARVFVPLDNFSSFSLAVFLVLLTTLSGASSATLAFRSETLQKVFLVKKS